jgi:diguanylate cyclase (GGDEF)-like protein
MPTRSFKVLVAAAVSADALFALAATPVGAFTFETCADLAELPVRLSASAFDALVVDTQARGLSAAMIESLASDLATLVVLPTLAAASMSDWFARGVQDVLAAGDLEGGLLAPRLRAAIERKKHERETRKAYATDLETGLPHQQQLIEHMSHLMALREREPAPMALLVLRIEGLAKTQARLGAEAAHVLRRKIGVRLRAGVRASDVVAALNDDSFGVLLASMLAPADAERVGAKLLRALNAPVKINGQDMAVATALGIAQYPQDGTQPDALLRRAIGLAASAQAHGRFGLSNTQGAGRPLPGAANDD